MACSIGIWWQSEEAEILKSRNQALVLRDRKATRPHRARVGCAAPILKVRTAQLEAINVAIYKRGKKYRYKFMWDGEMVRESSHCLSTPSGRDCSSTVGSSACALLSLE